MGTRSVKNEKITCAVDFLPSYYFLSVNIRYEFTRNKPKIFLICNYLIINTFFLTKQHSRTDSDIIIRKEMYIIFIKNLYIFLCFSLSGRPGTLSARISPQTSHNRNRCRSIKEDENAVKQHDSGFLMPSHTVTDV